MSDLSKVKIGESTYNLKDAAARESVAAAQTSISAEVTRATGVESGLDTRISNLEARGRFLSNYTVATGLPTTYPDIPSTATTSYEYEFKSGDYYIVGSVPASGTKYMPDGDSITASRESTEAEWSWTVGKKVTTESISVGDQFVFDGANWVHIAAAKDIAWGSITGTLSDQSDLNAALGEKANTADLGDLAYKDSASAEYTPAGTISEVDATPAGSVTLNDFTQTSTVATISTKADYTPAGTVTGSVTAAGSVTLNAFTQTATDITSSGTFTPAGSVAAVEGGDFSALKTATFAETTDGATGSVQIAGTVSKPAITVNDDTTDTFVKSLKAGDVAAASIDSSKFSGGSFTGATAASFTQGSKASFTQGSKASFDKGTAVSAAIEGVTVAVDTTDTELLVFTAASKSNVISHDNSTFTANGDDTFVANGDDSFTANNVGTFTAAAINDGFFSAEKLPVVDGTAAAVTAVTAELAATPAFTGKSYIINTTADTALKTVAFTGTEGNVSVAGQYDKATANGASFSGSSSNITAEFAGTKAEQLIPTEVKYDKATANGASFSGTTNKITPTFSGTSATIEVE